VFLNVVNLKTRLRVYTCELKATLSPFLLCCTSANRTFHLWHHLQCCLVGVLCIFFHGWSLSNLRILSNLHLWIAISVDTNSPCTNMPHDPVCDTDGQEHPNICYLIRYQKKLAYTGSCLVSQQLLNIFQKLI
jgi:hypothetical protein